MANHGQLPPVASGNQHVITSKKYLSEDKENSPLDLTVGTEKRKMDAPKNDEITGTRKAEKRSTGEAPIDLAPKRIKTETSKVVSCDLIFYNLYL